LSATLLGCNASTTGSAGVSGAPAAVPVKAGEREPSSGGPIEMFSWWARVGESDALGAVTREHAKRYPKDVIINASAELSGLARKTLRTRMLHNEPPETFQANIGYDLMQWVLVNGLDARESKLLPLDGILEDVAEWRRVFPPQLLAEMTYDGKLYAVPSNVHRINTVFYHRGVFAQHGLSEPDSVEALLAMGNKLEGSGISLFAVGSREPWTLALLAIESLLVAREGATFYNDYLRGKLTPEDPRLEKTLEKALELSKYFNPDHAQLNWLQALELVVRGQAAMTFMGDWARVSFNARGMKFGQDYGEFAFPGSEGVFVYTSDTFPIPIECKNQAGAKHLLSTIGSKSGQYAMNLAKGSLSARTDVELPGSDAVLRSKRELLHRGPLALALSGIVPPQFAEDLGTALAEMVSQQDAEPVLQTLRSRYALLR
jgi:glucose/mannose transport system substrate-binding protein